MRITTFSPIEYLPEAVRDFVVRRAAEAGGACLLAGTVVTGLALTTWSIQDPSWNHAVDGPVRNLLGAPGAVTADLIMQLVGISIVTVLPPVACWAWRLMVRRRLDHVRLRLGLLLLGGCSSTALASALPATDRWPLPTGLGGVVGDAILSLPRRLFGTSEASLIVVAVILAGTAILSLTASAGFGLTSTRAEDDEEEPAYEWVPIPKGIAPAVRRRSRGRARCRPGVARRLDPCRPQSEGRPHAPARSRSRCRASERSGRLDTGLGGRKSRRCRPGRGILDARRRGRHRARRADVRGDAGAARPGPFARIGAPPGAAFGPAAAGRGRPARRASGPGPDLHARRGAPPGAPGPSLARTGLARPTICRPPSS